jgi:hypothetical protein
MLSKVNSFGLLAVMAVALLLLFCFAGSAVYADGAAGQSPSPPPQPSPPAGGDDGTTFINVIGILLFFII